VLVVRDVDEAVFGAYVSEGLKRSDTYYGTGESFLWRAEPFKPDDIRLGSCCKIYRWTGNNSYNVLSGDDFISVGGGDGHYGLWIDAAMDHCVSAPCPTFNNEILCTHTSDEKEGSVAVLTLEVWRVGR